jgi:hypothetical protein
MRHWRRDPPEPSRTRAVTVTVTPEDIARGTRRSCTRCPVAIALQRATGRPGWLIGYGPVFLNRRPLGRMSDELTQWLCAFDAGRPVPAIQFTIDVPEE